MTPFFSGYPLSSYAVFVSPVRYKCLKTLAGEASDRAAGIANAGVKLPDARREPLPGDGALDRSTLQRICAVLRSTDATTTQFWRREPVVRALLRQITALQADLFERMSACPGKSYNRRR